ncbi:MAG: hypothetical protein KDA24_11900 [Deltaproteobacteria bacterium]|nr:hypothetical protein [Deltaproteobacteria bacterium]
MKTVTGIALAAALGMLTFTSAPPEAHAAKLQGPQEATVGDLPVTLAEEPYFIDPMKRAAAWPNPPPAEGEEPPLPGRVGEGPWRLYEGTFDAESCRSPRLSSDGTVLLSICRGLDPSRPGDEHVVLLQESRLHRYANPIAPLDVPGGATVDLSQDGNRFAVVIEEGGGRSIHIINLETRTDTRISGGWRSPGNPVLSPDVGAVAFTAEVAGRPAVVAVSIEDQKAWTAWHGGRRSRLAVFGVAAGGKRVLLSANRTTVDQLFLVDVGRNVYHDLSGDAGNVTSASLHESSEAAVFTATIGGACGVFWVDLQGRKAKDFVGSVDTCYANASLEETRRYVMYEVTKGEERTVQVYDRKKKKVKQEMPPTCQDATFSGDGRMTAARCQHNTWGWGIYLFLNPEE